MDKELLEKNANQLVSPGKGILAADESNGTMSNRLESVGVSPSEESRREYRTNLFSTEGYEESISGVILFDETIRQSMDDGTLIPDYLNKRGILPGIKVDTGAKALANYQGEKITEGLDGLRERCSEYFSMGARFAKWRAVIGIGADKPSDACISTNAHALARYSAICQEQGLVPIIEPEVNIKIEDKENNKIVIDDQLSKTIQSLTNQETTEIYLKHELHRDLYLTLNGVTPGVDGEPSSVTITVREIPGIILVWIGSFLTILGMIMTMFTEWKPGKEWLRKMAN